MTVWAVILAFVAASNPVRRRTCLSIQDTRSVAIGAALACVAYTVIAVVGVAARDALDVSAPNARVAAGLVLLTVGLHAVVAPLPAPQPTITTPTRWLVPVLFPVFLRPDLALVALAADRASDVASVVLAAVLGVGLVVWLWVRGGSSRRGGTFERAVGAVLGAVTVLTAVRLLLDGVFAI